MENGPSNGELAVMFGSFADKFDEFALRNQSDHDEIKKHVELTNGRVGKLEQAKWMLYGGWIIASAIFIPLALSLILSHLKP